MGKYRLIILVLFFTGCGQAPQTQSNTASATSAISSSVMLQTGSYTDNVNGSATEDPANITTSPGQGSNFTFTYAEPVTADGNYYPGSTTYNVILGPGSTEYSGFFYVTGQTSNSPCWVYDFDPTKHYLYLGQAQSGSNPQTGCNVSVNYSMPYIQN